MNLMACITICVGAAAGFLGAHGVARYAAWRSKRPPLVTYLPGQLSSARALAARLRARLPRRRRHLAVPV